MEKIKLKNIVREKRRGISPYKKGTGDNEYVLLKIGDLSPEGLIESSKNTIKVDESSQVKRALVKKNDVLISMIGSFKSLYISDDIKNTLISQNILALSLTDKIIAPQYLSFFLNSKKGIMAMQNMSKGTVQKSLSPQALLEIEIPVPSLDKQKKIIDILDKNQKTISSLKKEISIREDLADSIFENIGGT